MPSLHSLAALGFLPPLALAQGLVDSPQRILREEKGEMQYLADFDADGDDDVVWFQRVPGSSTRWQGFQVLFNDGAGDLALAGPYFAFPTSPNRFGSLLLEGLQRLGDVTGDGLVDMLAVERTSTFTGDVSLLVYPGVLPVGTFGAPLVLPLSGTADGVTLGNVDADGTREIAVVERRTSTFEAAWYDWNGAAFAKSAVLSTPYFDEDATNLEALDLDGDGDDDLVHGLAFSDKVRLLHSAGGALVAMTPVVLPVENGSLLFPYVCDLVGGGVEDVLVVAAKFGTARFQLHPLLNQAGTLVPQAGQSFVADWGLAYGDLFRVGDWDGDGDADVAGAGWQQPGGSTDGVVAFFENDGTNAFGLGPAARVETNDIGANPGQGTIPVAVTDLDGDGHVDLVGAGNIVFGNGRFESALVDVLDAFFGPTPRALGDTEGDGDLDLYLSSGEVLLNDGSGAFPASLTLPPAPPARQRSGTAGIGDFNGDGRADFLMGIWIPPQTSFEVATFEEMRLYVDDGLGGFADAGHASNDYMLSPDLGTNRAHDLDGDGDLDLLGRTASGGGYWPNGQGTFARFETLFPGPGHHVPAAVGDVDGDGDPDVITVPFGPYGVFVWENRTPERHARRLGESWLRFRPTQVYAGATDPESATLVDLDQDGDLDLAFTALGGIHLYANDGAGHFAPGPVLATSLPHADEPSPSHLSFDDLDGDGDLDLLAGAEETENQDPRLVLAYRARGDGSFEPARAYAGGVIGSAGDLDGDGDLDLAGRTMVRSRAFDGPADGRIRQYGAGTPGSGGVVPVLGAAGPLRPGSTSAGLRVRRGLGGGMFALFHSLSAGTGPTIPFDGAPTLLAEPFAAQFYDAGGSPGEPGAGAFDLDLGPELLSLQGFTIYFQAGFVDPEGSDGFALSNGLALRFGQ